MRKVECPYCLKLADLVTGERIYPHRADLHSLQFYLCSDCNAYVGCHKGSNGAPLGRLANTELRAAKNKAHFFFDRIWKLRHKSRSAAYQWLSKELGIPARDCHIGMFDIVLCNRTAAICSNYLSNK
ncbi:TPA: zinc-finger-containing protein [Klebsiella quasipneumoniae]